ncbi:MAG: RES family NAD+ phosphorylase [Planctomycetota bacterium]|jgi:filamentous hemagglutinin
MRKLLPHARKWSGRIYRATTPKYGKEKDLVSGAGAKYAGARWSPKGGFPAVYGSLTPETALAEVLAYYRRAGIPVVEAMPRILVAMEIKLKRVLDLSDGEVRNRLRISLDRMMSEDWRKIQDSDREALTQAIARAAREAGFEALLTPSATDDKGMNLVIFQGKLLRGSRVEALKATKLGR